MPGPRVDRRSYTVGSRASSRRVSRESQTAVPTRSYEEEGIPGSERLRGTIRGYTADRSSRRAALKRIRKIMRRAPSDLTDVDPKLRLLRPIGEDALGKYLPDRDMIKLSRQTTTGLAGKLYLGEGESVDLDAEDIKDASQVFLHELVHANQRRGPKTTPAGVEMDGQIKGPRWRTEGAAELLSRKLARNLFGHRADTDHPYQRYVQRIKKQGRGTARAARRTLD